MSTTHYAVVSTVILTTDWSDVDPEGDLTHDERDAEVRRRPYIVSHASVHECVTRKEADAYAHKQYTECLVDCRDFARQHHLPDTAVHGDPETLRVFWWAHHGEPRQCHMYTVVEVPARTRVTWASLCGPATLAAAIAVGA